MRATFRRVDKVSGDPTQWREWAFLLKAAVGSLSPEARELLAEIQKSSTDPAWDQVFEEVTEKSRRKMPRSSTTSS